MRSFWLSQSPAVGPILALSWALEVGDVGRFSSIKKAISYCGLCGAEKSSGDTIQRTPLSKQRNRHLQTILIEAAKMAPRNSSVLAMIYDREKQKGNANRATLAVARKMVAYLVAVDRPAKRFSGSRERKRRLDSGGIMRFLQRAACQVSPKRRLGNGAQTPEAHFEMFQDWQEITNSIFCEALPGRDSKWMSGSKMAKEPRPRGTNAS
jgi:transposase IS116/IS110/IS902 family protein